MGTRLPHHPSHQIATLISGVLRALSICVPVALADASTAMEQETPSARLSADIPAQPLAQALAAFAEQTGLQVAYVSGLIRDQRSKSVRAGLPVREALTQLLEGTGLRIQELTASSVRILAPLPRAEAISFRAAEPTEAEVLVTADRRTESIQDVPMTIQVLTNATLNRLNATTFEDVAMYLPGLTVHGVGPAQNNIYMRGLGTGETGIQAAGSAGAFPNVAIYLDEQSAQLPGRNLDVYAADLQRIEALQGPQGTLFGAGAEAGVLRYITNKPKLNVTEAAVDAGYATTTHGAPSSALQATLNVPVIPDRVALRGVLYSERRGGYIDNIPATFARTSADASIQAAGAGGQVPANSVVINNSALVANDINPVTYGGIRVEALVQLNDGWSVLLAQSYQSIEADGVFTEAASNWAGEAQPALTVQLFNPSYDKDRFENTALTINGRLGPIRALYAGSYLARTVDQVQDYTNYAHGGAYADYYQCINTGKTAATARCFTPSSVWRDLERNTHQSHELRLTTPDDWRMRAVGGLFYENYKIYDEGDWFYLTAIPYFNAIAPPTGYWEADGQPGCICTLPAGATFVPGPVTSNDPNARPPGDAFFNDVTRGYTQNAAYLSADFDLIPQELTLTAGTRYFRSRASEVGSSVGSFGCSLLNPEVAPVPDPCINRYAIDLNPLGLDRTYSGFRSRVNLSWKPAGNVLIYYTGSQGFRPGGFNRGLAGPSIDSPLYPGPADYQQQAVKHRGWTPPISYAPDNLTNNELGWKTSWLEQRLDWNGSVYQENWNDAQVNPTTTLTGGDIFNGGNYRVRGVEMAVAANLIGGLAIDAGASWNHGELIKEASLYWNDGTPIDFSTLRTSTGPFPNPLGTLGSPLPGAPDFQGNITARYELLLENYEAFIQVGAVHQSHSLSFTGVLQPNQAIYDLPPFTTYEATLGVGKDEWLVQLYGVNLTDVRAQLFASYYLWYKAVTVNRPRTIGLRVSYGFSGDRH
jgi:iron complex outermembrane recepter protein